MVIRKTNMDITVILSFSTISHFHSQCKADYGKRGGCGGSWNKSRKQQECKLIPQMFSGLTKIHIILNFGQMYRSVWMISLGVLSASDYLTIPLILFSSSWSISYICCDVSHPGFKYLFFSYFYLLLFHMWWV